MSKFPSHAVGHARKRRNPIVENKLGADEAAEERSGPLAAGRMIEAVRSAYGPACAGYLDEVLRELKEMGIGVEIASFWDCGWRVRIGDERDGFLADHMVFDDRSGLDEIAPWLRSTAQRLYPHYARWRRCRIDGRIGPTGGIGAPI